MRIVWFLTTLILLGSTAFGGSNQYPRNPDPELTPGELCTQPTRYRYPEQIPYCERDVDTLTKDSIIVQYDSELDYAIRSYNREHFKIDHYIPLCMGGSNGRENLWPQHKSIFAITDPLEEEACTKMAQGKLKQTEAVELIKKAKHNLTEVEDIRDYLQTL